MMPALFPCFSAAAPGQGKAFGNQGFTDILIISTNPGEGAPVTVLSASIDLHPLPPEELSKPFLRLEACHQLGITPRPKALRSVHVQEPDPLRSYGDCVSVHDDGAAPVEGFSDAWEVHKGQQTKSNA
jgi:hypothetical protein